MNRLFAAAGVVVLWAYARACRERNATRRRLARANLLRRVTARANRCHDCGRADGGCNRVVTVDITPDVSRVTKSLQVLVFKASPAEAVELWKSYFGRKLTPWEREIFAAPGLADLPELEALLGWQPDLTEWQQEFLRRSLTGRPITYRDVEIPPRNLRQRLDGATSEAVTKALHDAGGEWWREDSGDATREGAAG